MGIRVVSWNIHGCVGSDGRYDIARVAHVLHALNADVIGLQEVDWRRPPHEGMDALAYIAHHLGMNAVEGPNLHDHRGHYGNGLVTRFEVLETHPIPLAYAGREPRGAIDARLGCGAHTLRVLVTHLGLKFQERQEQLKTLRAALSAGEGGEAAILVGDLNEWRRPGWLRRELIPTPFQSVVTGRSYPSRWPLFRLDAIFSTTALCAGAGGVVRGGGASRASDHLPVLAELAWPPGD